MPTSSIEYSPITDLEGHNEDSSEKLFDQRSGPTQRCSTWRHSLPWLIVALLVLYIVFVPIDINSDSQSSMNAQCVEMLSTYSPANKAIEYRTLYYNGTFDYPSQYRGHPSPELDAAWKRISTGVPTTRIFEDTLRMIGKDVTPSLVKFSEADGGGYMASLEFAHQLHCLDLLRMNTYSEYYESFDLNFKASSPVFRHHLDHCIEMLRQNLMCAADTGLITYHWVEDHSLPYPDFNTRHTCRNMENIIDWTHTHASRVPESSVTRLEGQVDRPVPP